MVYRRAQVRGESPGLFPVRVTGRETRRYIMHKQKLFGVLSRCLLSALLVGGITTTAMVKAVDGASPGLLELDGNTVDDTDAADTNGDFPNVGIDWDYLYDDPTDPGDTPTRPADMIEFSGVVADPAPKTVFWKGGSKDIYDITEWWYKDGAVPDKDDITNAYAAAFTVTAEKATAVHQEGDLIVYFGLDRYANSGDAFAGFWFFQDDAVGIDTNVSSGEFSGAHVARNGDQPGDVLVLVEYPQASGAQPEIKVYEWDPNQELGNHVTDTLALVYSDAQAKCDGQGDKLACAITNSANLSQQPDWPYTPKSGSGLPFESFFEGGLNVTRLLGATPCFSSFLAETRSSRSETATLKDFAFGGFDVCGAEVTKACEADINQTGDSVTVSFHGTALNSGGLPLDVVLTDTLIGDVPPNVTDHEFTKVCVDVNANQRCDVESNIAGLTFSQPGASPTAGFELAAGQTLVYEGEYTVTGFTDQTSFEDKVTMSFYDQEGNFIDDAEPAIATCPPEGDPGIAVTKDCANERIEGGDTFVADVSGYVENTGNVKLQGVNLTDTITAPPGAPALTFYVDANANGKVDAGEASLFSNMTLLPAEKAYFAATVSSTTAVSQDDTITASGTNFFDANETVISSEATAACALSAEAFIDVKKECDARLGGGSGVELAVVNNQVVVRVGNIITVENTGLLDINNVTVTDTQLQAFTPPGGSGWTCYAKTAGAEAYCEKAVMAPHEKVVFTQTYLPDGSASGYTGGLDKPNTVFFTNTVEAVGTGALGTGEVKDDATASCELCPPHVTPGS